MAFTQTQKQKKTKSCHQQLKKQMTHISSHCHTQFLSHLQMQVTCMKLSFGLGSASYLNVMRFSKPSHIITHLFPILPRLVSNNHINNFQAPKNALSSSSLSCHNFCKCIFQLPTKQFSFCFSSSHHLLLISFLPF